MKVIGINGSARKDGNTAILINKVFEELNNEGIETKLIQLAGTGLHGCLACYKCLEMKNKTCIIKDELNGYIKELEEADGIILGSPVYFADVSSEMKAFIDRVGFVVRANDAMFKRKVGTAVTAVRRAGSLHAFDSMNHFFQISQMYIASSNYWNLGVGGPVGTVLDDEEGMKTMQVLGQNMAYLIKKLK
jgi:multimeric flavodoxin WrbA